MNQEDRRIRARIPLLRERTAMYVPGHPGCGIPEWKVEELRGRFQEAGFRFLYLPEVFVGVSEEMVEYMFPGVRRSFIVEEAYAQIMRRAELQGEEGVLYKLGRRTYFQPMAEVLDRCPNKSGMAMAARIDEAAVERKAPRKAMAAPVPTGAPGMAEEGEAFGHEVREIVEAWKALARRYGVTIDEFYLMVKDQVELSRMEISRKNEIRLIDWEGAPVVRIDDLSKTLYFFFLRHPEGAVLKQLERHRDELMGIYSKITGREDLQGMQESVARLTEPYSQSRDALMSRIRKAFKDIVGDPVARFYYIDGKAGGVFRVRLDRDNVLWEH